MQESDAPAAEFLFYERRWQKQRQREGEESQPELLPVQAGAGASPGAAEPKQGQPWGGGCVCT